VATAGTTQRLEQDYGLDLWASAQVLVANIAAATSASPQTRKEATGDFRSDG
jgi:hypothetical protein